MNQPSVRSGYTLPVFACASAIAALRHLQSPLQSPSSATVDLLDSAELADIPIEQIATLPDGAALAITRSDPGDNLDLTRHTPVWAVVRWAEPSQPRIQIQGGEGVGRIDGADPAIYTYARRLLQTNLERLLPADRAIQVTVILPEGKALALRTSNAAFGVVDGLSLLGTTGIAQPLSVPGQLEAFRSEIQEKAKTLDTLVFCLGENGLDLALQQGIRPECRVKTANWLGPLLVEAALQGITGILLFGYHGKLIKLAGGIFHTHHHVADGRQEILAAVCAEVGLPTERIQQMLTSETTEAGLELLREWGEAAQVYGAISTRIDQRTQQYIRKHCDHLPQIGTILFDRRRQIIVKSANSDALLAHVC
ncbi:MAG: cobalt-precorrin-5B (C(1))-methyltransferase CbiD [Cyanobacteria bacterium J06648_16]